MNVKNIKSFIDFYKSLEISTCMAPFPRILNNENQKKPISKKFNPPTPVYDNNINKDEKLKELI